MQDAQTESLDGVGRYTIGFVQGIVRNRGPHEVVLALNGLLDQTIEPIRHMFEGLLPKENFRVWYAPAGSDARGGTEDLWQDTALLVREAFLQSLEADIIHVCNFAGRNSTGRMSGTDRVNRTTPVTMTLRGFSIGQHISSEHTGANDDERRQRYLEYADLFFVSSEFAREEVLKMSGLPPERIVKLSSAIGAQFRSIPVAKAKKTALLSGFGVNKPFIFSVGGDKACEDLLRLVRAYALLPEELRTDHQLVFAGEIREEGVEKLRRQGTTSGLSEDTIVFVGQVDDKTRVELYNLCSLSVFPAGDEDSALSALEAMACGAPAIGANAMYLPEVINEPEALFDPKEVSTFAEKMAQCLDDADFRDRLRRRGLEYSAFFSWDRMARHAISAWRDLLDCRSKHDGAGAAVKSSRPGVALPVGHASVRASVERKPRLAFVSPLPPERSGIADYAAELIPALAEFYDIDVIVDQKDVEEARVQRVAHVRDSAWLLAHAGELDRVVYQVGNSPFHNYMLPLMRQVPGTVVLHDFYLSGLMGWRELLAGEGCVWSEALYEEHGIEAVLIRLRDIEAARNEYPVSFYPLSHARGVIFHSDHALRMAKRWYSPARVAHSAVIPLLREPAGVLDKAVARGCLKIDPAAFVICSFGFLGETKQTLRLLKTWLSSGLAADKNCELVFVGELGGGEYGRQMLAALNAVVMEQRVRVTGFVSAQTYRQYLTAADMAVQLRTHSRGETSAAALDCMNYGLPLIVNANGSMAEIDESAVWMLPDEFTDSELLNALESLWKAPDRRRVLGERAQARVHERNSPAACAQQYAAALDGFASEIRQPPLPMLVRAIAKSDACPKAEAELARIAEALALTFPSARPCKRLFLDITATSRNDLKTGIERVARALLLALLKAPPAGWRIEPVYLSQDGGRWRYRRAARYVLNLLGWRDDPLIGDAVVVPDVGEAVVGLDISGEMLAQAAEAGFFRRISDRGAHVQFMVYDLLPVRMPEVFPPGADSSFERWLRSVCSFDGAVCISQSVAEDLARWREANQPAAPLERTSFPISWVHLGADVMNSAPSRGLPQDALRVLWQLHESPTFLMVGTIEPRKGYGQVLEAFSQLWRDKQDVNLVIVGREGWLGLPAENRRDIPQTIESIRNHPELGRHLFWLEGISDEYLEEVYSGATCLLAASYDEGFGLPLIEAAQHGLPLLVRDIPVFREVAGERASYFCAETAAELVKSVRAWLALRAQGKTVASKGMPFLSWAESAVNLTEAVLKGDGEWEG
ncbi:glycosyltransferase [Sodalis sp. RH15]|uniref:glycosyltransferase n=1 Tax=Sodalis sp. RH15 TaxID=3394330 RepID=UPI0039B507B5